MESEIENSETTPAVTNKDPCYYANLWNKRKFLHKKRVQRPQDWFGRLLERRI